MWFTALWDQSAALLPWAFVLGAALAGAVFDLVTGRIPNLLCGCVLAAGLVWAGVVAGVGGVADAVTGCLMLMLPYLVLFRLASGGAGDAKLMGALGAWLGTVNGLVVLGCVAVSGVVLGVVVALAQKRLRQVLGNIFWVVRMTLYHVIVRRRLEETALTPAHPAMETRKMPYGLAIFCGVCIAALGVFLWRT